MTANRYTPASWVSAARRYEALLTVGVAMELVYIIYFLVYFPLIGNLDRYRFFTDFVTSIPALLGVIAAFSGLFFLLVLAWRQAHLTRTPAPIALVLGFGTLFAVTLWFVYPIHGLDIFKYAEAGTLFFIHHRNPMTIAPLAFPHDLFTPFTDGLKTSPSPYGPLGMILDSLPTPLGSGSVLVNVLLLKAEASAFVLADAYLVYRLLAPDHPQAAVTGALLVAWNPLVLFECAVNGHNDAAVVFFVLLALVAMSRGRSTLSVVAIAVSALVKYGTIPLLPVFLLYGLIREPTVRHKVRFVAQSLGISLVVSVAAYAPFWAGTDTFSRSLQEDRKHYYSFSATLSSLSHGIPAGTASLLGRGLFVLVYGMVLWLVVRRRTDLTTLAYLTMFVFLALAVDTFRAWYAVWSVVPAVAVARSEDRVWAILFSYLVIVGVMIYAYGPGAGGFVNIVPDAVTYLLTFAPAAAALLVGFAVWRRFPESSR